MSSGIHRRAGGPDAAMLDWLARIGAATAAELAAVSQRSVRAAAVHLAALQQAGIVRCARLLHGAPPLYTLTRLGLREAGRPELDAVAVGAGAYAHMLAVARVALVLEQAGRRVGGERELRCWERLEGRPLASAEVGLASDGSVALHRPDLVCWDSGLPIAIEVELTVKAPARLATIVRGWARSRLVQGVVYYAGADAGRALERAVRSEGAAGRVAVLEPGRAGELGQFGSTSSIPRAT